MATVIILQTVLYKKEINIITTDVISYKVR